MTNMTLGSYTFATNPSGMDVITPIRYAAKVKTYTSVAFFSWGTDIVGQVLRLMFNGISTDQYDQFLTLLEADAALVFDPQDGESKTYNVEMLNLNGEYFIFLDSGYRRNVTLDLLILSEVA